MTEEAQQYHYEKYVTYHSELLGNYIPPHVTWSPADEALFAPDDFYRLPVDEAERMQLAAMQFAFTHHYQNNRFYRAFCEKQGISPTDIKTSADMAGIPLIPDTFFKKYPRGKELATWIANLYTGELPQIVIKQKGLTDDLVVDAFNNAGLIVTYSSGTSGRYTFIPRDYNTFRNSQYSLAKSILAMSSEYLNFESEAFLLMPDPGINSLFMSKTAEVLFDIVGTVRGSIDQKMSLDIISRATSNRKSNKVKIARLLLLYKTKNIINTTIDWLMSREGSRDYTFIFGPPYLLYFIIQEIRRQGKSFNFGERGRIVTFGGWKIHENIRLSSSDFRAEIHQVLGIPDRHCIDTYGMVESNGWMVQCPEGHYFHIPYSYFKPFVLDENLNPLKNGEWGRFAFLDASALSYPGFILTGDQVRLLEKCPVCDRSGPVLEPEIKRVTVQDDPGCAEDLKRLFIAAQDT
jgi:long-chain-fatty-acid---luciferin-component ligase